MHTAHPRNTGLFYTFLFLSNSMPSYKSLSGPKQRQWYNFELGFFMSKSLKCKINTNMRFLHQIICKAFKKLLSIKLWYVIFFKLQLLKTFRKETLHIFIISHVYFGSQEKMTNRWSICSPERSRSTDWSLLVMVCRVRIAKESKVGNAWKIKYF